MTLDLSSLPTVGTPPEQVDSSLDRRNAASQAEARQPDHGREVGRTHIEARHILLKRSPYAEDEGELIGRDPRTIPLADWRSAGMEPVGVMQAVRAKCLDCCGDQPGEVRKCVAVTCPIWPFRMGVDVFHGKRAPSRKTGE
jgi:hypothetical protein